MEIKNCAVIYNPQTKDCEQIKIKVCEMIKKSGLSYNIFPISEMKKGFDIALVIGGDGTILKAAGFFADTNTAIFGINSGRLGFLSQTGEDDFSKSLEKILNGEYRTEKRLMLEGNGQIALNDFVIKSAESGKVSRFLVKINGKELCNYLADGIIVSTPTGSTAYCLSANGPVLAPNIDAMVIVPICPHTLSARPLVVPASEIISVSATYPANSFTLSADGNASQKLLGEISIKVSDKRAKLIILDDKDFYTILQTKLNWGISPNY